MKIGKRAAYPESGEYSWEGFLQSSKIQSIELAFYRPEAFEKIDVQDMIGPIKSNHVEVLSVHMAHINIAKEKEFLKILERTAIVAREVDTRFIVAHPTRCKLPFEKVANFMEEKVNPVLDHYGAVICWETFTSRRRFLAGPKGIANFCKCQKSHSMCYDFSHMHKGTVETLKDIEEYLPFIKILHLSNWVGKKQHLPLFIEKGQIDFHIVLERLKRKTFTGYLIFEYLPEFQDKVYRDYSAILNLAE